LEEELQNILIRLVAGLRDDVSIILRKLLIYWMYLFKDDICATLKRSDTFATCLII
jgi:hypothetical protein